MYLDSFWSRLFDQNYPQSFKRTASEETRIYVVTFCHSHTPGLSHDDENNNNRSTVHEHVDQSKGIAAILYRIKKNPTVSNGLESMTEV